MSYLTIIGDIIIFSCGAAVGHYGPKAVVAWLGKQARSAKKRLRK